VTAAAAATNETRGTVLAESVEVARSFWARFMGLMGRRELASGSALFLPGNGIHMFFMRFPIDAVFLDRELAVVGIEDSIAPWRAASQRGAKAVLELPAGESSRRGIAVGDKLTLAA
jgi:uncharacterized protein